MKQRWFAVASVLLLALMVSALQVTGQGHEQPSPNAPSGSSFTYQGQLEDANGPVNATCHLQFGLWDSGEGGTQVGALPPQENISLVDSLFTVQLDFGPDAFQGDRRWLEVSVSCPAGSSYVTLVPRQELTASPYALSAPWSGLSGMPPGFADGVDHDTTYSAGFGLSLSAEEFSVDTATVQARVGETCPEESAIRAIDAAGAVTCQSVAGGTGDVTAVYAGTGLSGGGESGDLTLDLAGPYQLPQLCTTGQIAAWDGAGWICDDDRDSGGDITAVSAGSGLSGGGISDTVVISADTEYLQRRVSASCTEGSSIRTIHEDGTVVCQEDDNSGGDVTAVYAGTGLSGGGEGGDLTLDLAGPYQLPQLCTEGQIAAWDGTGWVCDDDGDSGGDITAVAAGSGLSGGGISGTVVISADTEYLQRRVSAGCTEGSSIRAIAADGSVTCEQDDDTTYSAGSGLTLTLSVFSVDFAGPGSAATAARSDHDHDDAYVNEDQAESVSSGMVQNGTLLLEDLDQNGCGTNQVIKWNGSAWACANDQTAGGYWSLAGNTGTSPGIHFLGTTDDRALELKVNGNRALRLEPDATSPNLMGGHSGNDVTDGVHGATISGGGRSGEPNRVTDHYGTVGGGVSNRAGDDSDAVDSAAHATVAGGTNNTASGHSTAIGGGGLNTASMVYATVGGGGINTASGSSSTVGGGYYNTASGDNCTVGGGTYNSAGGLDATVGGGSSNTTGGRSSTIAGGSSNTAGGLASTVGGGWGHAASSDYATVGGGYYHAIAAAAGYATVGGGSQNVISDTYATIGGGYLNIAEGYESTVAGGADNRAAYRATVGGGLTNQAAGSYAAVLGGYQNQAEGTYAAVGGGRHNRASADFATISGGGPSDPADPGATHNRVTDEYGTIGGGGNNQAGDGLGTLTDAGFATVGGGYGNSAIGVASTVGGGFANSVDGDHATTGGGFYNVVSGNYATVSGGYQNSATDYNATVGGGRDNSANGEYTTVGGGLGNEVLADFGTICGGGRTQASNPDTANRVTDRYGTVGGGGFNQAGDDDADPITAQYATVGGGHYNRAYGAYSTVGGGIGNGISTDGMDATVSGGSMNSASSSNATVGGGEYNIASNASATVGGGFYNTAEGQTATVGGGDRNTASGGDSAIGGGSQNTASGSDSTIGGGTLNTADGQNATVGGGWQNSAEGYRSTVAGGASNSAGYYGAVGGGEQNHASGSFSTVPGGLQNTAAGGYSFAAGHRAVATNYGCFVWAGGDGSYVECNDNNRTIFRSSGGFYIYSDANQTFGVKLDPGAWEWQAIGAPSDPKLKEGVDAVDYRSLLERLARQVPVSTWRYAWEPEEVRHMGPMAPDFYGAFGLGSDETRINPADAAGVALAAVQGLYQLNQEQATRIEVLEAKETVQQQQIAELEARLAALEAEDQDSTSSVRLPAGWLLLGGVVVAAGVAAGRHAWGGVR